MSLVYVMLWLVPLISAPPAAPARVLTACDGVNTRVARAAHAAVHYVPAWERDLRDTLAEDPAYAARLASGIRAAARASGLDPALIWGVAYQESRGRHRTKRGAVKRGAAGEVGLMQLKPFWQRALRRAYGVQLDLYDLEGNLLAATYVLKRGGAEAPVMLSYYNTGRRVSSTPYQRRVMRHLARLREDRGSG